MRRRCTVLLAACAAVAALAAPMDAGAAAAGPFGHVLSLSGAGQSFSGTDIAAMPDGTTAVTSMVMARTSVSVLVRPRGSSTWGPARTLTLPAAQAFVGSAPEADPLVPLRATSSGFLAAWTRSLASSRETYVAPISSTGAWGAPVKVSGSDVPIGPPRLEALPDGTAAVQYMVAAPPVYLVRVVTRTGAGTWSAPVTVGSTTVPINASLALDASRTVTSAWLSASSGSNDVFLRSRVAGAWGPITIASSIPVAVSVINGESSTVSLAAAGSTTVAAVLDDAGPAVGYTGPPSGVAVRTLVRTGSSWAYSSGLLQGTGHYALAPVVSGAPDGSAVVQWVDLSDGLGAGTPPTARTMLSQRRGMGGAWSTPGVVEAVAAAEPSIYATRLRPSLAPDGAYTTPVLVPRYTGGGTIVRTVAIATRPTWAGLPVTTAIFPSAGSFPVAVSLVAPSGRTTVAALDETDTTVLRTTSLPKPFALTGPALSTKTPRVGRVVTCSATWSDALTVSYRWLRGGKTIGGATAASYRARSIDRGKKLSCLVTATDATGSTAKVSAARVVR